MNVGHNFKCVHHMICNGGNTLLDGSLVNCSRVIGKYEKVHLVFLNMLKLINSLEMGFWAFPSPTSGA